MQFPKPTKREKSRKGFKKPKTNPREETWRQAVFSRDGYICRFPDCGLFSRHHDAHHIAQRSTHPELVYEVDNGVTLCRQHHTFVHDHPETASELGLLTSRKDTKK